MQKVVSFVLGGSIVARLSPSIRGNKLLVLAGSIVYGPITVTLAYGT